MKWGIATLAIAVGVGLGLAVHLIHQHALEQFNSGVRQFAGVADLQLLPHSERLPESVLETVVQWPEVAVASPILELQVAIDGMERPVRWLGLDVFTAALVTPNLLGQATDQGTQASEGNIPMLNDRNAFASPALMQALQGEQSSAPMQLRSQHQGKTRRWDLAGTVPAAGAGQVLLVSDIAAVQAGFGLLGQLSRIDIKLREGISPETFTTQRAGELARLGRFETPAEQGSRGASVSQAYRANLSILAMVALLTGGFLSFSTQMLAVAQRARQWALLAAMGCTPSKLRMQVLFESACCGLLGGLAGVVLGFALAQTVVSQLGVDLGAGYFETSTGQLRMGWQNAVAFALFGGLATVLGGLAPALQTGRMALQQRLRAGTEEAGLQFANRAHWLGLALCAAAVLSLWIPPRGNVPVGGYLAVAFGLFGGIACIGLFVRWFIPHPPALGHLGHLARARLASTPNLLAVGLSGVVASFALVVAMHVMIYSFRHSLDEWLNQVLPAPLYMKPQNQQTQIFPQDVQRKIARLPELAQAEFWGQQSLILDPARPAVELIARPIATEAASARLPMTGPTIDTPQANTLPVWVSEPVADLYGKRTGDTLVLPLDGGVSVTATVMGVWRDYTRQHGAIVLPKALLAERHAISFDDTQAAAWPRKGVTVGEAVKAIQVALEGTALQDRVDFAEPGEIRQVSLDIFDRSFAVTYLLEIAAVVIGLFGVGTTFSAMALQRKREFALLGALGAQRSTLLSLIAREALLASLLAAGVGMMMGLAFAAVLVFVVNPQSFHWTMNWHMPWRDLAVMVAGLLIMSTATVMLALRGKLGKDLLVQLKEDWA
ncbi:MAG TPA: ABC transporter permease [Limnobacter sp.]|nr:ABC transporter permease [Limnobacter sp.]